MPQLFSRNKLSSSETTGQKPLFKYLEIINIYFLHNFE